MPGPAPRADRQTRPSRDLPWVDLPGDGRQGKPPKLPTGNGLQAAGKRMWTSIWSTPAATQWGESEIPQAVRRCQLEEVWLTTKDTKVLPEIRHLEAALGLTPKSRKELRWRIVEAGEVVEENGRKLSADQRRKRMHVVDSQAS